LVVHVHHAADALGDGFGQTLGAAVGDGAGEGHLAVLHFNLDVARVDVAVGLETVADLFVDPLVGALVAAGAAAAMRSFDVPGVGLHLAVPALPPIVVPAAPHLAHSARRAAAADVHRRLFRAQLVDVVQPALRPIFVAPLALHPLGIEIGASLGPAGHPLAVVATRSPPPVVDVPAVAV